MKIYLAGVIGGGSKKNEIVIKKLNIKYRLCSYYYKYDTVCIFETSKEKKNEDKDN